jgi:dCMP deaminase
MPSSGENLPMVYDFATDPMHSVYFRQLYRYAENNSKDPSTQNAALLLNDDGILCMECNNIPHTVQNTDVWERPLKYHYVEHAERNVLYKAARLGIKTEGLTMYCPWYACSDCARAIIQCGISRIIGHKEYIDKTPNRWKESCNIGLDMMKEAGIGCYVWSGVIGARTKVRVNDTLFEP